MVLVGVICMRLCCCPQHQAGLPVQAFLQRGGGRLAHLADSLFHTVDTGQQGALSLKVQFRRFRALIRLLTPEFYVWAVGCPLSA